MTDEPQTDGTGEWRDRRLSRGDDRRIAGVASGVADYFGIDPTLVRLGFVVTLVFTAGMSLLAYFILWIVLPTTDGASVAQGGRRDQPVLMVLLGLAAVMILADRFADVDAGLWSRGVVLPILLVAAGVVLLRRSSSGSDAEHHGIPPSVTIEGSAGSEQLGEDRSVAEDDSGGSGSASADDGGSVPPYSRTVIGKGSGPPPAKVKTPNVITPVVMSMMLIAAGVGLGLDLTDTVDVRLTVMAGIWLLIVAGGLLVSTVRGRAGGLIALGIVTSLLLVAATVVDPIIEDGTGDRTHVVESPEELLSSYTLGVGKMTVDLSALDLAGETREVEIELAIGHLIVVLPAEAALELVIDSDIGDARFSDTSASPASQDQQRSGIGNDISAADDEGDGLLIVTISNRIGEVEVTRVER